MHDLCVRAFMITCTSGCTAFLGGRRRRREGFNSQFMSLQSEVVTKQGVK